jgi:hypothetical protein
MAKLSCVSVKALAHFHSRQPATGVRRESGQARVQPRQRDNAIFELIADPEDPVKFHAAFDCETTKAAVTGQQWPTTALSDGEGERVSRR